MTITLAAWTDYIWIAVIGATIIGSMIGNIKKKSEEQRKQDEGPGDMEIEQLAARRREQLRQQSRTRAQAGGSSGMNTPGGGEPGNLTMAERIARARAKAQYEQRAQTRSQPAPQQQVPNEAQRRALAQRQAELERRRQAARAQQQAQERARLQAQQRAQRQAQQQAQTRRQQRATTHARAQAQARQRGVLIHDPVVVPETTESTTRRRVSSQPARRDKPVLQPIQTTTAPIAASLKAGMSRDELRKAIVLTEVLGKPIALREDM